MELFDILKARAGIPVSDPMAVMFGRKKSKSAYDETKITVITHDTQNENSDDIIETFSNIEDAVSHLKNYYSDRYRNTFVIGSETGVTEIASSQFEASSNLKRMNLYEIIMPDSITRIENYAFKANNSFSASSYEWEHGVIKADLPKNLTFIGALAFHYCVNYDLASFPKNVKTIGGRAFYNCKNITADLDLSNVETIGEEAFGNCEKITSVILPSINTIPLNLFRMCISLSNVVIPDGVVTIKSYAFGYCINLKTINIPNSITTIENNAFKNCPGITITIDKPTNSISGAPWGATNATVTWTG